MGTWRFNLVEVDTFLAYIFVSLEIRDINRNPLVACHMGPLEASPSHSLEAVALERNFHPSLHHPFQALVAQVKQEAATEHTYSAGDRKTREGISSSERRLVSIRDLNCLVKIRIKRRNQVVLEA